MSDGAAPTNGRRSPTGPRPRIDGWRAWWGRLGAVVLVVALAVVIGSSLASWSDLSCARSEVESAGHGRGSAIVALELAGTPERADDVLAACNGEPGATSPSGDDARTALLRDFVFIAVYGTALAVGAAYFGPRGFRVKSLRQSSRLVVIAALVAAGLDVVENLALLGFLGASGGSWWEHLTIGGAAVLAWGKFVILAAVGLYLAVAMAGYVVTPAWVVARRDELTRFREPSGTDFHPLRAVRTRLRPSSAASTVTPTTAADAAATETVTSTTKDDATGDGDGDGGGGGIGGGGGGGGATPDGFTGRNRPEEPDPLRRGVAISGGGIRSASFGLGALQTFEGIPDLRWDGLERVTSVSGGSYLSGGWAIARGQNPTPGTAPWSAGSQEDVHLRRNLGYLLEGSGGVPGALFTLLVGLAINVAVLLLLLLVVARSVGHVVGSCAVSPEVRVVGDLGTACLQFAPGTTTSPLVGSYQWTPALTWLAVGAAMSLLWLFLGKLRKWPLPRKLAAAAGQVAVPALAVGAVLFVVLVAVPWAIVRLPELFNHLAGEKDPVPGAGSAETQSLISSAVKLAIAAGVGGAVVRAVKNPLARYAPKLGGVLLGLLALLIGLEWSRNAAVGDPGPNLAATGIVMAAWLVVYWATSSEWWSMAPFYRSRLRKGFATYRRPDGAVPQDGAVPPGGAGLPPEAVAYQDSDVPLDGGRVEPSIYRYAPPGGGPEIQICCAMTVSDKSVKTHYGIPALSVRISPERVEYFIPRTADQVAASFSCTPYQIEQLGHRWDTSRLTTMAAVGMSGAAVSPAMGRMGMGSTDALLAFANLRLGVWLPNPRYASELPDELPPPVGDDGTDPAVPPRKWPSYPRVRPGYLLKELLGLHDPDDLYVYVTDGGHWENTSIVEQLRIGDLTEVVCLDGSGVAIDKLTSFSEAIDLAPLECDGVTISARLDALRASKPAGGEPPYAERCCTIALARRPGFVSVLWYAKPILTRDNQARLLAYWERDNRFPAHGTIDQFFDEEQFECYRLLGVAAAIEVESARLHLVELLLDNPAIGDMRAAAQVPGAHWVCAEVAFLVADQADYDLLRAPLLTAMAAV